MLCRAREAKFTRVHWIWFNAPVSVFSSVDLSTFIFYYSTAKYCVASLTSISLHLWPSRTCAEPRRALARRGGAGLVLFIVYRIVGCSRGYTAFLGLGFSRQHVHFSVRFFLVVLLLARPPGPPPAAASAMPSSSRGGVWKVWNAGPITPSRWHRPHCHCANRVKYMPLRLRDYSICTPSILAPLH